MSLTFLLTLLTLALGQDLQPGETSFSLVTEISFDSWLGIDKLKLQIAQPYTVALYVYNTGTVSDNYQITYDQPENVRLDFETELVENVIPGEIRKVLFYVYAYDTSERTVTITVTSQADPSQSITLSLRVSGYLVTSTDESVVMILLALALAIPLALKWSSLPSKRPEEA